MAFKLTQKPVFTTPVVVNIPNDKGGFDRNTFVAKFKRITAAEREELSVLPHHEVVRRVLVDWEMKDGDSGEEVPFTQDNLDAALQILPTPIATALAFWDSVNGARTKN